MCKKIIQMTVIRTFQIQTENGPNYQINLGTRRETRKRVKYRGGEGGEGQSM